jgi:hypothetical protein
MKDRQTLMLPTLAGPQPIEAPAGWKFDKTGIRVWSKLLEYTEDGFSQVNKRQLQRDEHIRHGRVTLLANILANSFGMAGTYWQDAAFEIVVEKRSA